MIRAMLFQAYMSMTYWVEALHMATHLFNILPSSAITNDIPYSRLFLKPVFYNHLRIFGCLWYPNLLPTSLHKLAPHSTKYVFLGYPTNHRGYRCLDLHTKRIIISRRVVLDKGSFPFHTSNDLIHEHIFNSPLSSYPILQALRPTPPSATHSSSSTTPTPFIIQHFPQPTSSDSDLPSPLLVPQENTSSIQASQTVIAPIALTLSQTQPAPPKPSQIQTRSRSGITKMK